MEMMIEDLKQLRESEDHIEFKEAKRNYPFAGGKHVDPKERRRCVLGYIVALANEKGGRLVLGMADKMPHTVVGSDFAQDKVGELTDEIYERLGIRIEATELYEDGKRVLVLSVPSRPIGRLLRFEGVLSCVPEKACVKCPMPKYSGYCRNRNRISRPRYARGLP